MGVPQTKEKVSIEEYLEIEAQNDVKYEFHDGDIYAMAGGTIAHSMISGNAYSEIKENLRSKNSSCKTLNSDAKIFIKKLNSFVYPDASVVCDKIEESEKGHGICNPTLIVEVLSKSTEGYDRGAKFSNYRKIPTLQEYVLIEQEKAEVEVFYRPLNTDLWKISTYTGLGAIVLLESIDLEVPMSRIYLDVSEDVK